VLAEWVFVVYVKDGSNVYYTGPYMVVSGGFTATQIDLVGNPHYPIAPLYQIPERPATVVRKYGDPAALAAAAKADEIDIGFHLPIDEVDAVRAVDGQNVVSFETGYHYMMFHNTDTLELEVREAIDLAIDREALVAVLNGGTGTRSVFPDYSPFHLPDAAGSLQGDAAAAEAKLDAAGWTLDGTTGLRTKAGADLTVRLVAYPQRAGLPIMQPVIESALTALGITVTSITTSAANWDELDTITADRTFDLLMWAQNTLPAGDSLWFLNHFFRTGGGGNYANFASDSVDSLLDTLSSADSSTRVAASAAAQTAILAAVPVSNLVTPFWHVSLSDRMGDYEPWGSDYHVIRADYVAVALPPPPPLPVTPTDSDSKASSTTATEDEDALPWILVAVFAVLFVVGAIAMYCVGKKQGIQEGLLKNADKP
jgi:peptide/nickel transport system substrate-binding protein